MKFCSHKSKQPKSQVSSYPLLLGNLSGLSHNELFCDFFFFLMLPFQTDEQQQNILLHHSSSCCSKHLVTDNHAMPERFWTRPELLTFSPEGCTALAYWDAAEASFWTLKHFYCDLWGCFTYLVGSTGIRYKSQCQQGECGRKQRLMTRPCPAVSH